MKDWDDDFTGAIDDFLVDEPVRTPRASGKRPRQVDPCCSEGARAASGDLFSLLAIPWTDQETTEFLRLVGIEDLKEN